MGGLQPSPPSLFWVDLAVFLCVCAFEKRRRRRKEKEQSEHGGESALFFFCVLCNPGCGRECSQEVNLINQVARGNSTSCFESDPLISLALPSISESAHLSYVPLFFPIIFHLSFPTGVFKPAPSLLLLLLLLLRLRIIKVGDRLLDLWGRSSPATMRHLLASVVGT